MVPIPKVHDLSVLNERLMARCLERLDALEAGEQAAALLADLEALRDLPAVPFEACEHVPGQVSSTALVRYRLVDYSAPAALAHKKVTVKGYVDRVEIALGAEIVARHRRSYVRGDGRLRPAALSVAPGEEAGRPGPGDAAERVEARSRPSTRCAASSRRASARAASANTSRCCACTKTSRNRRWRPRCADAVKRRLIGFDAVKHLLLARIERRPVHLGPGALSAPAPALRRRHAERRLRHPAGRRGRPWLRPPASCSNIT